MKKLDIITELDAVVIGLKLAITAPTEKDSQKVMKLLTELFPKLTKKQIEKAKTLALSQISEMN
jgi:hypothetical protein|tara:strand:+ start:4479 stop:4670 length:192 start_codon:yes stop_codon:yes gene_type:complete